MKAREILIQLELLGTEQTRKTYARHGVKGHQFGVSYGRLRKLAKKAGQDHDLAEMLWRSANHDARVLACMLADPAVLDKVQAERWARDLDNYVLTDSLAGLVSQTVFAREIAEEWIECEGEWVSSAGWNVIASLAMNDSTLTEEYFMKLIQKIERDLQSSHNRTRYNMNNALIAIGIRSATLRAEVEDAAKRIGKVDVDHGETSCKTPDAIAYIQKTMSHRARKSKARQLNEAA